MSSFEAGQKVLIGNEQYKITDGKAKDYDGSGLKIVGVRFIKSRGQYSKQPQLLPLKNIKIA